MALREKEFEGTVEVPYMECESVSIYLNYADRRRQIDAQMHPRSDRHKEGQTDRVSVRQTHSQSV